MMISNETSRHPASVGSWLRDMAVAGAFLTRLPFRPAADVSMADLGPAGRVFPVIGLIIGGFGGAALWLASQIGLPPMACGVIGLAMMAGITGALHEDGLADFADGMGGGDRPRRLEIMRDSRIGTFGVLALIFAIGIKATLLAGFPAPGLAVAAMITAAAVSRGVMPVLMFAMRPARVDGLGQGAGRPSAGDTGAALGFSLLITVFLFEPWPAFWALTAAVVVTGAVGWLARRRLGGYTGDVLGAAQQSAELAVIIAAGAYAI